MWLRTGFTHIWDHKACHLIRSILRLCEQRFGIHIQHRFCPSHAGEPGNELVDQIAFGAASGHPLQDWTPFVHQTQVKDFGQAMEWAWMLFTHMPAVSAADSTLHFPAKPATTPEPDVIPVVQHSVSSPQGVMINLNLATCNVLTLQHSRHTDRILQIGAAGPTRQEWIFETLDEHGIHVFALQETRLKKVWKHHDPRFHLIQSAAAAHGHFGMMIGLSKLHPYSWNNETPICFAETDFSILVAEPRLLIVAVKTNALKCVLMAAHAPHTGATQHDIEMYWESASAQIPQRFDTWPKILLADANCRIGGQPDGRVGDWQSEGMHDKANPSLISLQCMIFSYPVHLRTRTLDLVGHGYTS